MKKGILLFRWNFFSYSCTHPIKLCTFPGCRTPKNTVDTPLPVIVAFPIISAIQHFSRSLSGRMLVLGVRGVCLVCVCQQQRCNSHVLYCFRIDSIFHGNGVQGNHVDSGEANSPSVSGNDDWRKKETSYY